MRQDRLHARKHSIHTSIEVGKYLISPITTPLTDRGYRASVSIRSGKGSHTHDRVLRLLPRFDCEQAAARFALAQGLAWLNEHHGAPALPPGPPADRDALP